mmetsp:Transcript_23044/g.55500  ORF Transcript_23044/g.55500 Transcript_23044/m.55500 type:complete len:1121 (-) Transcript_23044:149-3511(-)
MGTCNTKLQERIIADPPSVYNLERAEEESKAARQPSRHLEFENTSEPLVERILQLELENSRLRTHLQLLAGANAIGTVNATAATGPVRVSKHDSPLINFRDDLTSCQLSVRSSFDEAAGATEKEAELEAEAADLSSNWKVVIEPEPHEGCTVIQIDAPDTAQLLTDVMRIFNGLGLVIANAHISHRGNQAHDEFWVREMAMDGSGEMCPAHDVHAIEQRLRQWSEGEQSVQQLLSRPLRATHRLVPLHIELPWPHSPLPKFEIDTPEQHPFWPSILFAMTAPHLLPFRVRSAALARLASQEVVQGLERVNVPAGSHISRGDAQWLLVVETRCVLHYNGEQKTIEPGSVLCNRAHLCTSADTDDWDELSFPEAGLMGVMHLSALRSLLQTARTVLARVHAQALASSPIFSPLSPAQLLALCLRATEIELRPGERAHLETFEHEGYSTASVNISSGGSETRSFHVILRGALSAILLYTNANGQLEEVPIARLEPISTVGAMGALTGKTFLTDLRYAAGEDGASLLIWPVDEFLKSHLHHLPSLLPLNWTAQSPLALLAMCPELARHLRPCRLEELSTDTSDASTLVVVTSGELIDDVSSVKVSALVTSESDTILEVTVNLHSVTCPDVSSALNECGLRVISASITTDDSNHAGVLDSTTSVFTVYAPSLEHHSMTTREALDEIQHRVVERLDALLAPGNWPMLTSRLTGGNWFPLRAGRIPHVRDGNVPPSLALLDLATVAKHLASMDTELGRLWRRFAKVHAQDLLKSEAIAPFIEWNDAITSFQLFRLRLTAGLVEDGVTMKDLKTGPQLGSGAFGIVVLAQHVIVPQSFYAVKTLKKPTGNTEADKEMMHRIQTERLVMQKLSYESRVHTQSRNTQNLFVRLISSWEDENEFHLVMPAALGGELFELLLAFGRMTESALQFYVAGVVLGLQHLHLLGIVHRDLKSSNILLSAQGWPMLADFGFATFATPETPLYKLCGTPEFVAPEIARGLSYGTAVDWWSLGIVMCHCLTLATPFEDPSGDAGKTIQNICDGRMTLPENRHYRQLGSKSTVSLIDSLLQADPAQRLGSHLLGAEVRLHPFFWGLAWDELDKRQLTPPHRAHCEAKAFESTKPFIESSP